MRRSSIIRRRALVATAAIGGLASLCLVAPAGAGTRPASTGLDWIPASIQSFAGLSHTSLTTGNMVCAKGGPCVVAGAGEDLSDDPTTYAPLIWMRSGSSWKLASSGVKGSAFLVDSTCPGAEECWTVGTRYSGARDSTPTGVIDRFDGRRWTPLTPPEAAGVSLNGVDCVSSGDCLAVGNLQTSSTTADAVGYRWDGHAWERISMLSPAGAAWTALDSVRCASATQCVALGDYAAGTYDPAHFFSEGWNGRTWAIEHLPSGKYELGSGTALYMGSCLDNGDCLAVGDGLYYVGKGGGADFPGGVAYDYRPHGAWKAVPISAATKHSLGWVMNADSCDGTSCWVPLQAGPPQNPYVTEAVARWSGGGFSVHAVDTTGYLDAISCSAHGGTTTCLGLGEGGSASHPTLIAGSFSAR